MYIVEIALLALGVALLIGGYRKNSRNTLVAAALLLFLSAATDSFVGGFIDGLSAARPGQKLSAQALQDDPPSRNNRMRAE